MPARRPAALRRLLLVCSLAASPALGAGPVSAARPPAPEARDALARLEASAGRPVEARWDRRSGRLRGLRAADGMLTSPDPRDPGRIARDFVASRSALLGLAPDAAAGLRETRRMRTAAGGLTVVELTQTVDGIPVHRGQLRFALSSRGEVALVQVGDLVGAGAGRVPAPALDGIRAVDLAVAALGLADGTPATEDIPAGERFLRFAAGARAGEVHARRLVTIAGEAPRPAWQVIVLPPRADAAELLVDAADGGILERHDLTRDVATSGCVFAENPGAANQIPGQVPFYDDTVLVDPRWPLGWCDLNESIGNVVDVKDDRAGDDEATLGMRSSGGPTSPFSFCDPWTNSYETTGDPTPDLPFTLTQVFYFANVQHDWMYGLGFDEPAGNWQRTNFGRGGREGDRLYADVLDAYLRGARNNANFASPPDGISPRLQLYPFTNPPFVRRDTAVDGDVVFHELTHGVTQRLVGGADSASCLTGFQGGALGEGWSDWYACAWFDDPVMGEYVSGNPTRGIRSAPFDAYPACHRYDGADFCSPNTCAGMSSGCEVHDEGELWTATLWEMRTLLRTVNPTSGSDIALKLVTDGLKLTACNPSFLDARDAILEADRLEYAGAHLCLLWEAFAGRYMGWSATTVGPDDTLPTGANDLAPFCQTPGAVALDRDRYACDDLLVATVHDGNAPTPPTVRLTSTSGDVLLVATSGLAPEFRTPAVQVRVGAVNTADTTLQVQEGDTIAAEYSDASPPRLATAQATVDCTARVETTTWVSGGCSPDGLAGWPVPLPEILDAGETVDLHLWVYNREPRPLDDLRVTLTGISDPEVALSSPVTASLGTVAPLTGAGHAVFTLTGSSLLAGPTATVSFQLAARGFHDAAQPMTHAIATQGDYVQAARATGVEDFESGDGGYSHFPFSGSPDEWAFGVCGAASGTGAWHAGPPGCSGDAAEQDAVLASPLFNPSGPLRPSWYPTALLFNHRLDLGGSDTALVYLSEPQPLSGGEWGGWAEFAAGANTGGAFQPVRVPFTAADTLGAGLRNERGLQWDFDFYTLASASPSRQWAIDDVELEYAAAEVVPASGPVSCLAGFTGRIGGCPSCLPEAWVTLRPGERQQAGNGEFTFDGDRFTLASREFPTPPAAGETLLVTAGSNPGGGGHAGQVASTTVPVADPSALTDVGTLNLSSIPIPMTPPGRVSPMSPIVLRWTPISQLLGPSAVVGYDVYRIDADAHPPAVSTIDDYVLGAGMLVGSTFGTADIDTFTDSVPFVRTGCDHYSYAIRPLLACDGRGCTGSVPATVGGSESTPGTPNLSSDSAVVTIAPPAGPADVLDRRSLRVVRDPVGCPAPGAVRLSWSPLSPPLDPAVTFHVHELAGTAARGRIANPYPDPAVGSPVAGLELCHAPATAGIVYLAVFQNDPCSGGSLADP